jgi:hypothetical protein
MSDAFEKFAKLRQLYPEDISRIEGDEKRLNELFVMQEFANLPVVGGLVDQCRKDILFARKALATNRALSEEARGELWQIIQAREWFIRQVVKDFASEVTQMDAELDRELNR